MGKRCSKSDRISPATTLGITYKTKINIVRIIEIVCFGQFWLFHNLPYFCCCSVVSFS